MLLLECAALDDQHRKLICCRDTCLNLIWQTAWSCCIDSIAHIAAHICHGCSNLVQCRLRCLQHLSSAYKNKSGCNAEQSAHCSSFTILHIVLLICRQRWVSKALVTCPCQLCRWYLCGAGQNTCQYSDFTASVNALQADMDRLEQLIDAHANRADHSSCAMNHNSECLLV